MRHIPWRVCARACKQSHCVPRLARASEGRFPRWRGLRIDYRANGAVLAKRQRQKGATIKMYFGRVAVSTICLLLAAGCLTNRSSRPYADLVLQPVPPSESDKDKECAWISSEVAHQESTVQTSTTSEGSSMFAFLSPERQNIADLKSRSSQIQCAGIRGAPTLQAVQPKTLAAPMTLTFDQCFAKCRELTSRSEAQCFDSCRH
jgi:hypothetical protein